MDVSVIIVNYNTCKVTGVCVDSIFMHTRDVKFEVILVDNASTDESVEFFEKDSRIILIRSEVNLGFGKANNLGYTYAKGKYLFLLNSDTVLLNNAIKLFYDQMIEMPEYVACMGAVLLGKDGISENNSYGVFPSICSTCRELWSIYTSVLGVKAHRKCVDERTFPYQVDFIIGADLFIRRKVVENYGLFDPDFFMYFEESEMQYRYSKAGYRQMIIDTPKIIHLECVSMRNGKKKHYTLKHRKMYFKSMFTYMRKRYSKLNYLLFCIIAIGYLPVIAISILKRD